MILAALAPAMGQDRIELGWQTTRRGIVWYQSGKPTHQPTYRLSRDTNAVLWVDTLTALRYDWDYKNDRWRAKGTTKSALPPLPQQTSGSALIDNTTAFWIRDTFNLLHKYDSTAQAWTPVGDFMYLSDPPTEIAASGSNGAAKYRRSLWQDADTYLVYYWDGSVWQQFGNASGGDNWGSQVAQVTARLSGDGTSGQPLDIAQQGATSGQVLKWNGTSWAPANDTDTDLQKADTFEIVSNTLRLSLQRDAEPFKSVNLAAYLDNTDDQKVDTFRVNGGNIELSLESDSEPAKTIPVTSIAPVQAIAAGTGISVSGTSTVTVTNTGDLSNTNEIQRLDTFAIVSNTLRASLLNDGVPFSSVDLSPYLDNTDAQTLSIDSSTISAGQRFALSISGGNTVHFEDEDRQQIDTFSISGQVVSLSVQRDGQPAKTITLPTADGSETVVTAGTGIGVSGNGTSGTPYVITNTGDLSATNEIQRLDTFEIVSNTLRASLLNDGVPFSSVSLAPYLDNTDDQKVDTFQIVSHVLRLSMESDAEPFKSVDLSPYVNVGTDLSYSGTSSPVTLNSSTGNDVTLTAGTGIGLSATSGNVTISPANDLAALEGLSSTGIAVRTGSETWAQRTITAGTGISVADGNGVSGNPTITNTGDLSATNEAWTIDADDADTEVISSQTVKFQGAGITTTDYNPATDVLLITSTEVDGSVTNEGSLTVGAGGANSSTIVSNTSGSTAVTVAGAGIVTVTESGSTITVTGTEVDGSTSNELQTYGHAGTTSYTNTLSSGGGSFTLQASGIAAISHSAGTVTISATEVDGSTSNELQTLNNTGDATSHTATLSNSGGSLKLKEGSNITLTTDATGLNGEVTISATVPASDGNGIYGDGTAGTGDDALPPGGSTVTIPGQWQPLNFAIDNSATQVHTALKVTTDYCSDDAFTKYLVGKSPSDSLEIYNFDCSGWIKETGGVLNIEADRELYLFSDSIYLSTVPARTIGAAMLALDGTGFVRKISGSSSGQILQWNGSNWALAAAPSGGITGAENGLTTVGSNVRLGGTLITTTIIGQAGFDLRTYGGKYGHSQYTGFSYSPTQTFGVSGYEGNPTTGSSPTADGIAEYVASTTGGSEQPNSLTIGAMTTDNNGIWMQARSRAVPNFYYPLLTQPNGGRFAVGRSGTTASHFTVTASGLTGSTASGMVGLFENSGGSGNVSVGFGAGSDAVSGQLMWNGTNDVMRIINRNGVSGTSKISFAIGGETSDRAHLIYTSTSPNARFSVGQTAANTHSTVQSGGSFATAFRQTTTSTTLTEADRTVVYTLNSTVTFTLPSATGLAGREYIIHHFGSGGNIALSSSVISSTGTTFSAVGARQWAYIISDGSNWQGYLLTSL